MIWMFFIHHNDTSIWLKEQFENKNIILLFQQTLKEMEHIYNAFFQFTFIF